jgi:hypothetical protein
MTDMTEVTAEQFFQFLRDDPRDIMPELTAPDYSNWKTRNGGVVARTYPGWRNPGDARRYLVLSSALRATRATARDQADGSPGPAPAPAPALSAHIVRGSRE